MKAALLLVAVFAVARPSAARSIVEESPFDTVKYRYLPYNESQTLLDELSHHIRKVNRDVEVRVTVEGASYERRPLKSYTIQYRDRWSNPIVLIEAGAHAREWHSQSLAFYFMRKLIDEAKWGENGLIYNYTFVIMPTVNPDGYEFSLNHKKLWRGNRVPVANGCTGVDLNRNYDIAWHAGDKESLDPCSQVYKGKRPFSEPETRSMARIMNRHKRQILIFFSIHTFGNKILYPWGYTFKMHPRKKYLESVGNAGRRAALDGFGVNFDVKQSSAGLYIAAGGADDYAMSIGIPFAYTLELGTDEDFFAAPLKHLPRTLDYGYEVLRAMILKAREMRPKHNKEWKRSL